MRACILVEVRSMSQLTQACKFGSLQSLEVYKLCVMMISLEVWKFGSLEVFTLCVMPMSLKVYKSTHCV